jgi:NADH:ubiquinone oxidoreductase subunit 3 (subunit A)
MIGMAMSDASFYLYAIIFVVFIKLAFLVLVSKAPACNEERIASRRE